MNNKKYCVLAGLAALITSTSAFAWDPMEGAEDYKTPAKSYAPVPAYKPSNLTPPAPRTAATANYAPIKFAPAPAAPAPTPIYAAAPTPAPVYTAAPVAATAPTYVPIAPQPAPVPYAAARAPYAPVAAAAETSSYSDTPANTDYVRPNRFAVGVEGFYDRYREPDVNLDSRTGYGSLTGEYTHYFNPRFYSTLDARASLGSEHYKSSSGTINGITDWEFESRAIAGYDVDYLHGRHFKPYIGLGGRYYMDDGKDEVTNLGYVGYDRRIFQAYVPIGFAFEFPAYGLQMAPKVEFDPIVYGHVSSRLGTLQGYENIENTQHSGFGYRAEFLVGNVNERGYGWQAGPFLRAWNVRDSETTQDAQGRTWVEPENTRLQVGATAKFLF